VASSNQNLFDIYNFLDSENTLKIDVIESELSRLRVIKIKLLDL